MGGAITKRDRPVLNVKQTVKFEDRPEPRMREESEFTQEGFPIYKTWLEPSPFGIPTDLSYRASQTPASDLMPMFMKDDHVLSNLKIMTKDKSARKHHPAIQQTIVHTLKGYPDLLQHYLHS